MSCHNDQGTAAGSDRVELGGPTMSGFLRVIPEEFSREELQAIRDKASDLLPYASMAKFDLLEDLVDTLDMLDAVAAREEADLAELDETITEHMGSGDVHVTHRWPPCSPSCPNHRRYINLFGLEG